MPGRICVALRLLIFVQCLQFDFVNSSATQGFEAQTLKPQAVRLPQGLYVQALKPFCEAACVEKLPAVGKQGSAQNEKRPPREQPV